ncbi:hypothetical protein D8674_038444 [Pyrus ussuriensis x Pyrus communis]|uniref:Uncharacterized protein n=1 Tax=Pyrus ussuriensis x Pyrus communis TaxID=2448454 RepID=A0A5N5FD10_9ROSA|nr:hypothetical protein D8674_038444 [Pyrus ussuriensis x Pyrus communis]
MTHSLVPLRHPGLATLSVKIGSVGENSEGRKEKGRGKAKATSKKVTKKIYVTCRVFEMAFKECKNEEDAFKLRLVYFVEAVLIRAKANITMNLDNLYLVEDMDRFNSFSWCSISSTEM